DTLSSMQRSRIFTIDNTPPVFKNLTAVLSLFESSKNWLITVSGLALDNGNRIAQLKYSLDTDEWFSFTSTDAMLDESEELFELILKGKSEEKIPRLIFLKVIDAQENITSSTVTVD
ncbi:hypothetical protein K8T06_03070, partial [bacterium]|nr:hypothetical protein [bacterium]